MPNRPRLLLPLPLHLPHQLTDDPGPTAAIVCTAPDGMVDLYDHGYAQHCVPGHSPRGRIGDIPIDAQDSRWLPPHQEGGTA